MRLALLTSLAALTVLPAFPAEAQADRRRGSRPVAQPTYPSEVPVPSYRDRYPSVYSVPPGYRGTIYWNTPNADGNLGGPGGGGSSGSSGG